MPSRPAGILSPREREIAAHVATGLSNRDIATVFVLSERTVETHVQNVLLKLDFHSRAQIAAWAVAEGLLVADQPGTVPASVASRRGWASKRNL